MIALTRDRRTDAVHRNFKGAKRIAHNLKLLQLKRDGQLENKINEVLNDRVWKAARKQLLIESKGKCAYCETPFTVVDYGDVEHFRPKSIYWWLAYCYENYLPSCAICNQRYKRDHFLTQNKAMPGPEIPPGATDAQLAALAAGITPDPVDAAADMPLATLHHAMAAEFALLIDPYFEDPAGYLAYQPLLDNKEIVVVPTKPVYAPVVEACHDFFGINRKELLDLRFQHYCTYMTYKHLLTLTVLPAPYRTMLQNRLRELAANGSRYAGMIRFLETKPLASLPWDFDLEITF